MLEVYKASVQNVREIKRQRAKLKRLFNNSIKRNEKSSFDVLTTLYALLYSSFMEVCFLKTIHTPYGLSDNEIKQVNAEIVGNRIRTRSLEQKWTKCLELAFQKIDNQANKGELQNKKQRLERLIKEFIIEPSQIRNKIAHGQWHTALNSQNTKINPSTSKKLKELDFVKIDILFSAYEKIGQAVEDLIESPTKAHFNDFYNHMSELDELILETKSWTLESKINSLKEKFERIEKAVQKKRNNSC
ncbi:hypothetical protein [Psychroserpens mesophilus]|uniref:hypothetical protein n=1 Tax=Psychroserpens mesophilus TaxID=325473 RepID=UPI00058E13F0|nr:hypothetical protein [Psychroserpens mesophilus]